VLFARRRTIAGGARHTTGAWWAPAPGGNRYRFHIRNGNPTPIYNCLVMLRAAHKPIGVALTSIHVAVLAPGETAVEERDPARIYPDHVRTASEEVGFTDSDGRHLRTRDGSLHELEAAAQSC